MMEDFLMLVYIVTAVLAVWLIRLMFLVDSSWLVYVDCFELANEEAIVALNEETSLRLYRNVPSASTTNWARVNQYLCGYEPIVHIERTGSVV
jgi:SHS2 domain-containing protein